MLSKAQARTNNKFTTVKMLVIMTKNTTEIAYAKRIVLTFFLESQAFLPFLVSTIGDSLKQ